jgi:hypothetical protein
MEQHKLTDIIDYPLLLTDGIVDIEQQIQLLDTL